VPTRRSDPVREIVRAVTGWLHGKRVSEHIRIIEFTSKYALD
jgi:hypothetical protein